ncbi:hypothetical protein C5F59_027705 [Streptomyces sp. QL37]|uniref:hypothetical protein n=1 Tax=Streptomyces sp. QL37 TaxID=2093747 RepID=UPI000CF2EB65|nr:hypothetical protein [Streptomyces sp. QL37]PPQ57105.1 hypothetical protein C5F59_10740 [Streptomyces sp. QL37]
MITTITRRDWLAEAVQAESTPVTTQRAAALLTGSPWPTAGRNTARKDLRALTARGVLAAVDVDGRRAYTPKGDQL